MHRCSCGRVHWGRYGAAGLLLANADSSAILLQKRSPYVSNPRTWALPGGAIERGESPTQAALREATEEVGIQARSVTVLGTILGVDHPSWSYTYVIARAETEVLPNHVTWEATHHRWTPVDVPPRKLHPDLSRDWHRVVDELSRLG